MARREKAGKFQITQRMPGINALGEFTQGVPQSIQYILKAFGVTVGG